MQLMSLNDCSPVNSRSSGSLGVTSGKRQPGRGDRRRLAADLSRRDGRLIALALVAAITIYGEYRSISELIEWVPPFRLLDSLGRE